MNQGSLLPFKPSWKLQKYYTNSDQFQTGKQVKRYLSHQDQSSKKVFSQQFCFIRCRRQHLQTVEQRRYSRLTLVEKTIGNSPKVPRAKFLSSDGLFCFISTCKFDRFMNPLATITSLTELYFRFRRFIQQVQTNKAKTMNYNKSDNL